MRYYKVLFDFQATDAAEMSVRKGDLVCAAEHVEQDGWLRVELAADTRRRGFVPVAYVRETTGPRSSVSAASVGGAAAAAAAGSNQDTSFTGAAMGLGEHLRAAYGTRVAATPGSAVRGQPPLLASAAAAPVEPGPAGNAVTNAMLQNPNSVVEAFMKNEVYFKQLMKQRQDQLARLESALAEAVADVAACKDKNGVLARKLRDLDQGIEQERRRWRERIEEEKLLLQRTVPGPSPFAAMAAAGAVGGGTTTTTTTTTMTTALQQHQRFTASTMASRAASNA